MLTRETHYNIKNFEFIFNNKELTTKHLVINSTYKPESVFFIINSEIISKGQNKPLEDLPHKFYSRLNHTIQNSNVKTETPNNKNFYYYYYSLWESNEPLPLFLINNIKIVIIGNGEFNVSHWFCDDNFYVQQQCMESASINFKQSETTSETTLTFENGYHQIKKNDIDIFYLFNFEH